MMRGSSRKSSNVSPCWKGPRCVTVLIGAIPNPVVLSIARDEKSLRRNSVPSGVMYRSNSTGALFISPCNRHHKIEVKRHGRGRLYILIAGVHRVLIVDYRASASCVVDRACACGHTGARLVAHELNRI